LDAVEVAGVAAGLGQAETLEFEFGDGRAATESTVEIRDLVEQRAVGVGQGDLPADQAFFEWARLRRECRGNWT
jgi:hypothetical protein